MSTTAVHTLAEFCESLGLPCTVVPELVELLKERELADLAAHEARMQRCAGRPNNVALPLRDDEGNEFGVVEARIPRTLFFNLAQRKGFGWEGLQSDEGIRDILKDNPQCRVNTTSGRIMTGYGGRWAGRTTVKKY